MNMTWRCLLVLAFLCAGPLAVEPARGGSPMRLVFGNLVDFVYVVSSDMAIGQVSKQ